jgi:hypothetical protein
VRRGGRRSPTGGWRSSRDAVGGAGAGEGGTSRPVGGGASREEEAGDEAACGYGARVFTAGWPFYTLSGEKNERLGFAWTHHPTAGNFGFTRRLAVEAPYIRLLCIGLQK